MLKFIVLGLIIYYIYTGYSFLKHMEEIKCTCATEHEDFQGLKRWVKIVIWTYVIGFLAGVVAIFKLKSNLKKNMPIAGILLLFLIVGFILNMGRIYYSRKMDLFSNALAQTKCECSKHPYREFNRFFAILHVIYNSLTLMILFILLINFKKIKPMLEMARIQKKKIKV